MGGIATITAATAATPSRSSAATPASVSVSAARALSPMALRSAFASAPPSIGSPSTAVKQDLQVCQAYMGDHVNTCLCYESNPSGTNSPRSGVASSTPSSSAAIRLCAAECGSAHDNDGFAGTRSDGYDGDVEVLGEFNILVNVCQCLSIFVNACSIEIFLNIFHPPIIVPY
jgi:hypothetical protein